MAQTTPAATPTVSKAAIPGSSILLMGDTGTGKTYSIRTWIDAGITPFVIFTEPGMETLGDLPDDKWHWKYIPPKTAGWADFAKSMQRVNQLGFSGLVKAADPNKSKYVGFLDVINQCNNFIDQNGVEFGDVATWGTDRVLVIDSLSNLSTMAMQLVVGGKVTRELQDWMIAQNSLLQLTEMLISDLTCFFMLTAHLERVKNEVTGGTEIMVSTLGKALAPELPKNFSDVIQATRAGKEFRWATDGRSVACKTRNLPIANELLPTFTSLVNTWKERGGVIQSQ